MKKAILMLVAAVSLLGAGGPIWAAGTDTISVTVSLEETVSVSVTPSSWTIGAIGLSGTSGPTSFTATVGNTATKLEIMASNGAGGWTIGATAGADQFVVAVTSPAITLTTAYQELDPSVAAYGSKDFLLTYSAPSGDTKGAGLDQGFTVTLKASAAP